MADDHVDVVIGGLWIWLSVEKLGLRQSTKVYSRGDVTYLLELRHNQIRVRTVLVEISSRRRAIAFVIAVPEGLTLASIHARRLSELTSHQSQ